MHFSISKVFLKREIILHGYVLELADKYCPRCFIKPIYREKNYHNPLHFCRVCGLEYIKGIDVNKMYNRIGDN